MQSRRTLAVRTDHRRLDRMRGACVPATGNLGRRRVRGAIPQGAASDGACRTPRRSARPARGCHRCAPRARVPRVARRASDNTDPRGTALPTRALPAWHSCTRNVGSGPRPCAEPSSASSKMASTLARNDPGLLDRSGPDRPVRSSGRSQRKRVIASMRIWSSAAACMRSNVARSIAITMSPGSSANSRAIGPSSTT